MPRERSGPRFSVVIPTMQRSAHLQPLVDLYCAHHLVGEVIIINNVLVPLRFSHPKVRVLQQAGNIFVNPSWNLGAAEAREELLIISNDDIWFDPSLLDAVRRVLRWPVGIVGPSWSAMNGARDGRPWFVPAYRMPHGFGTLMFMRKDSYVRIPDDLLILGGDDWLFEQQTHRNLQIVGARIGTQWSLTSARAEFDAAKQRDRDVFRVKYHTDAYADRFSIERKIAYMAKDWYRSARTLVTGAGVSTTKVDATQVEETHVSEPLDPQSPSTDTSSSAQGDQMRPGVEVVVVAYGASDMLRRALGPIRPLPVTVVDNSSLPEIKALSERLGCRYIDPGRNGGFAAGVNVGLAHRSLPGADVLLLNPDAVIGAHSVHELQSALRASADLASVGPRQVDEHGQRVRVTWPFPSPWGTWLDALGLSRLRPTSEYVSGAILLLRAEALDAVGGFDERFFLYSEEADWAYRARRAGWRHAVVDSVVAMHVGGGTSSDETRRQAHFHASQERFMRKHFGAVGWQVSRTGQVLGDAVRSVIRRGELRDRLRARMALYLKGPVRVEATLPSARAGE